MESITFTQKDISRFWSKVEIGDTDDCWNWKGNKFKKGYGSFQMRSKNKSAHRTSWEISFGKIPANLCVCHKCDNPSCVNPSHLFLGTYSENNKDRARKGRSADVSGEKNPSAKLTEREVREIRFLRKMNVSQRKVAKKYNVGKTTIARIDNRTHWKGVSDG